MTDTDALKTFLAIAFILAILVGLIIEYHSDSIHAILFILGVILGGGLIISIGWLYDKFGF